MEMCYEKELITSIEQLIIKAVQILSINLQNGLIVPREEQYIKWNVNEFEYTEKGITTLKKTGSQITRKNWSHSLSILQSLIKESDEFRKTSALLDQIHKETSNSTILDKFVTEFLRLTINNNLNNQSYFISGFVNQIYGRPLNYTVHIELDGITIMCDDITLELDELRVFLRKTIKEDLETEYSLDMYGNRDMLSPSAILKLELKAKNGCILQPKIYQAIAILRLFCVGSVKFISYKMDSESIVDFFRGGTVTSGRSEAALETALIDIGKSKKIKDFWKVMIQSLPEIFYNGENLEQKSSTIAYSRYCDALLSNGVLEKRIASAVMGLESTFLKGSDNQELTYKLSMRCAKVFSFILNDPYKAKNIISTAYKIRSSYVHGDMLSVKDKRKIERSYGNVHELLLLLLDYLRISIILNLLIGLEKEEFINLVDSALFDPAKNDNLKILMNNVSDYLTVF